MSDEKPSPGPWRLREEGPRPVMDADDGLLLSITIATVHTGDADAALIADAPVMLELLRRYVEAAECLEFTIEPCADCVEAQALLDKHGRST